MKVKTSVTLSKGTLNAVDKLVGKHGNRSAFIEQAVRQYVVAMQRDLRDRRDTAIYGKHFGEYDAVAKDVLEFQLTDDDR